MSEQGTFFQNWLTDGKFHDILGKHFCLSKDIRRAAWFLNIDDELFIDIPYELRDDPAASEQYIVGAIKYMINNSQLCSECRQTNKYSADFDRLSGDYHRAWYLEKHGEQARPRRPTWPKMLAIKKLRDKITDCSITLVTEGGADTKDSLVELVRKHDALAAEPDTIGVERVDEIIGGDE